MKKLFYLQTHNTHHTPKCFFFFLILKCRNPKLVSEHMLTRLLKDSIIFFVNVNNLHLL